MNGFPRRILGLDGGLTAANPTGAVILELFPEPRLLEALPLVVVHASGWEDVADRVGGMVDELVRAYQPHALAYELPHMKVNAQTALKLATLTGTFRRVARTHAIPAQAVQPAQAKKALTTNGAATKLQMMGAARRLLGQSLAKDEADAVGVALAGAALLGWFDQLA